MADTMIEIFKAAVAKRNNLDPDTLIQKARIESDGGTVINLALMDGSIKILKSLGIYGNAKLLTDANWGVKKDGSGAVSKLYDISGNNNDWIQTTGSNQPIWSISNGKAILTYNGTTNVLSIPVSTSLDLTTGTWIVDGKLNNESGTNGHGVYLSKSVTGSHVGIDIAIANNTYLIHSKSAIDSYLLNKPVNGNQNSFAFSFVSGGVCKTYFNNVLVDSLVLNINPAIGVSVTDAISNDSFWGKANGVIGKRYIFNIALTQPVIQTLVNAGL